MRVPSIVGLVVVLVVSGCGPKPETVAVDGAIPPCANLWPSGHAADTIRVALFDDVNPAHAPAWRNDSERLVFHHLYETLSSEFERRCSPPSQLVEERPPRGTRSATFTVHAGARFWDGTPVTARDIAVSVGSADESFADLDSVVIRDDGRVEVTMHSVDWAWLESPTRAVVRSTSSLWPCGTGRYMVDGNDAFDDGLITLKPVAGKGPIIQFIDARGTDPRDLLDATSRPRFDVVPLHDRPAMEYAATTDAYTHLPLGQTRAYVLLSVDRALAIEQGESLATLGPLQDALARDAVRTAFSHSIPEREWSRALGRCRMWPVSAAPAATRSRRIVYDAGDPIARDLADRIASLAATDPMVASAIPGVADSGGIVSTGLDRASFALSLFKGDNLAYVFPLRYDLPDVCQALHELSAAAPWLSGGGAPLATKVVPLVKTTSLAFVRKREDGYAFEVVLDAYFRLMIVPVDDRPLP